MGERTTVIGTILAVVFQNEENGYTVARIVTDDGEPVTVVGCIPCAAPGEELILTGRYTTHPQHGEQFAADEVERHMPTGETEILNYLASGVVRGIGPATAQKLVDRFGAVCNSTSIAGLMKLSPDAVDLCDGQFELMLVPVPKTPLQLQRTIRAIVYEEYETSNALIFRHVRHVTAESDGSIPWTLDGEYAPGVPKIEIGIEDNGIQMMI